jgi:hypothetical protein
MRRSVSFGSLVLALVALAAVANAAGLRARSDHAAIAGSGFVGTWRVLVTQGDGTSFPVLSTFLADGTTLQSGPIAQPAGPGAPSSVRLQSTGHGVWEATGDGTSSVTFEVLIGDEHGAFVGRLTISGVQTLDPSGDSFTGRYILSVTDPTGGVVASIPTTATATRMRVELPPSVGTPEATPAT